MTTLRKDGLPVVPICIDCKHYETDYCNSTKRKSKFDPVHGYYYFLLTCRDARSNNDMCGVAGNWFEPLPPPVKLSILRRVKNWLFS